MVASTVVPTPASSFLLVVFLIDMSVFLSVLIGTASVEGSVIHMNPEIFRDEPRAEAGGDLGRGKFGANAACSSDSDPRDFMEARAAIAHCCLVELRLVRRGLPKKACLRL